MSLHAPSRRIVTAASTKPNAAIAPRSTPNLAHVDALHLLGVLRHQLGQHAEAAELVRSRGRPASADAALQLNLGNALKALGRHRRRDRALSQRAARLRRAFRWRTTTSAMRTRRRAATKTPPTPSKNRCACNRTTPRRRTTSATRCIGAAPFRRSRDGVSSARSQSVRAMRARTTISAWRSMRSATDEGAIEQFRAAIAAEPRYVAAHFNLANMLDATGRPAEAVAVLERRAAHAAAIRAGAFRAGQRARGARPPEGSAAAIRARGRARSEIWRRVAGPGQHAPRARRSIRRRCARSIRRCGSRPDWPAAHMNRALALLALGDYARGLPAYEWRLDTMAAARHAAAAALERRADAGRTLLVRAEQGFGDTLQFVRFVPLAAKLAGRLSCSKCSRQLCRCSRPRARGGAIDTDAQRPTSATQRRRVAVSAC